MAFYRPGGTALNARQVGSTVQRNILRRVIREARFFDTAAASALKEMSELAADSHARQETGNVGGHYGSELLPYEPTAGGDDQ